MPALFDTHCHIDAAEFDRDRAEVIDRALAAGLQGLLTPAVEKANFGTVRDLAHSTPVGAYAIGIHPMYVQRAAEQDLQWMREFIADHQHDPRLVAIGEIGLDFFVPDISHGAQKERQINFYRKQLDIALEFDLPVLLHVRRSQDELLKWLRRHGSPGGFAHAFNGSLQQAQQFVQLGFALGIGGAMTYGRALQIRRLCCSLPLSSFVLETDAPDIAPAWLERGERNEPAQLARIAQELAELRQCDVRDVIAATADNAMRLVPRLASVWSKD